MNEDFLGLSERQSIENVVLQGDTFRSILASVQVDSIGKDVMETDYGYRYKDTLTIGMLGLVDDMIGVTDAGYKAQQMNAILNVKTAEKRLQFGITKCKSMLVSKNGPTVPHNVMMVDSWKVRHVDKPTTGSNELVETYEGMEVIKKTDKQKYLGFILSSRGDNMANINEMKNKSIWIKRKIFSKLRDLNLQKYYFECAIIFLNVMLRSSILYGCETYYNLKETEIRQLERIEESFLRKMFGTNKGCPITQLYLESGHAPARFEIKKTRLLFLQYILQENSDSQICKFLKLQIEKPTRGDWASSCQKDLKDFKIEISFDEIRTLTKNQFCKILKTSIKQTAFEYLIGKQKSKGKEIKYSELKMSEYLMPNMENLSIDDRRKIFETRNRMIPIPMNFPNNKNKNDTRCWCGEIEDTKHIYLCKQWTEQSEQYAFEMIYTDNMPKLVKVYKRFKECYKKREEFKTEIENPHAIPLSDPLLFV